MLKQLNEIVAELEPEIIKLRRRIHRHPEPGFEEKETAALISEVLNREGISHETGIASTGVVGMVGSGQGPVVGIRADMDALPICEATGLDYSSENDNMMHACGHDGHVAILLGVAMAAARLEDKLPGRIKLIFQPAEEGPGGALPMIKAGVLEDPRVDYLLALHIWSKEMAGCIGIKRGPFFASADEFDLDILAESAHGASPHQGRDAVLIASEVVQSLQGIVSRSVDPVKPAVITIGKIEGGCRRNVIADRVRLEGTVRAVEKEVRDLLQRRIEEVVAGICAAGGADYELNYRRQYPPLFNDEEVVDCLEKEAVRALGRDCVLEISEPTLGAEDFAYFLERRPGAMFLLGGQNPEKGITAPHHHPEYNFDEAILARGVKVFLLTARRLMQE